MASRKKGSGMHKQIPHTMEFSELLMDPLTHTATGLFLSRIGLKRWTPLATPILLLAANAPDVDIVTASGGSLSYLHYHRHLTHSLVAMPVMALLVVVLVRLGARKPVQWAGAFFGGMVAVASHLLLDLTNAYGIRLLLPFSAEWLRLDLNNIYDLWIWGVFLLCVAGPFVGRLVGSEIASGGATGKHHGRGLGIPHLCGRRSGAWGGAAGPGQPDALERCGRYRGFLRRGKRGPARKLRPHTRADCLQAAARRRD